MILDSLQHATRWHAVHPGFAEAFVFLQRTSIEPPSPGKHVLIPERLWVILEAGSGRTREHAPLEYHRRYIDIQLVLDGLETIGWMPMTAGKAPAQGAFDPQRDIGFLADSPTTWLDLRPGEFAVFFPTDAHAPLAGDGPVLKAIAKVAVDW